MKEFHTTIIPPGGFGENEPEFDVTSVIRRVMPNELEAQDFINTGLQDYHRLVVAYSGDTIYGFQIFDYDHHEMEIVLGRQAIVSSLSPGDEKSISERLRKDALDSYESC